MIEKDPNPNVLLWPPCTRVQRCSGCCPTDVLVCEPIMTEMVSLKVHAHSDIQPYRYVACNKSLLLSDLSHYILYIYICLKF